MARIELFNIGKAGKRGIVEMNVVCPGQVLFLLFMYNDTVMKVLKIFLVFQSRINSSLFKQFGTGSFSLKQFYILLKLYRHKKIAV